MQTVTRTADVIRASQAATLLKVTVKQVYYLIRHRRIVAWQVRRYPLDRHAPWHIRLDSVMAYDEARRRYRELHRNDLAERRRPKRQYSYDLYTDEWVAADPDQPRYDRDGNRLWLDRPVFDELGNLIRR